MASVAAFYLSVFCNASKVWWKRRIIIIRTVFALFGVWTFYNLSLIYARAAILTTFIAIGAIFTLMYIRSSNSWSGFIRIGFVILVTVLLGQETSARGLQTIMPTQPT